MHWDTTLLGNTNSCLVALMTICIFLSFVAATHFLCFKDGPPAKASSHGDIESGPQEKDVEEQVLLVRETDHKALNRSQILELEHDAQERSASSSLELHSVFVLSFAVRSRIVDRVLADLMKKRCFRKTFIEQRRIRSKHASHGLLEMQIVLTVTPHRKISKMLSKTLKVKDILVQEFVKSNQRHDDQAIQANHMACIVVGDIQYNKIMHTYSCK